ncbi:integral membrane protein [Burkholderia pseudomallei 668]|nr:integral membrane protein [Burkholderia pseudomallei 668]
MRSRRGTGAFTAVRHRRISRHDGGPLRTAAGRLTASPPHRLTASPPHRFAAARLPVMKR